MKLFVHLRFRSGESFGDLFTTMTVNKNPNVFIFEKSYKTRNFIFTKPQLSFYVSDSGSKLSGGFFLDCDLSEHFSIGKVGALSGKVEIFIKSRKAALDH